MELFRHIVDGYRRTALPFDEIAVRNIGDDDIRSDGRQFPGAVRAEDAHGNLPGNHLFESLTALQRIRMGRFLVQAIEFGQFVFSLFQSRLGEQASVPLGGRKHFFVDVAAVYGFDLRIEAQAQGGEGISAATARVYQSGVFDTCGYECKYGKRPINKDFRGVSPSQKSLFQ